MLSALEESGELLKLAGGAVVLEATKANLKSLAIRLDEEAQGPVSLLSDKVRPGFPYFVVKGSN